MSQSIVFEGLPRHVLYTPEQVRAIDAYAITQLGLNSYGLMRRAAEFSWRCIAQRWPDAKHLIVFCGSGNNAGDGFIVAALARQSGCRVDCVCLGSGRYSSDTALARRWAEDSSVRFCSLEQLSLETGVVLVDAMLGSGQVAAPRPEYQAVIEWLNASRAPVVALDLPTGFDGNSGLAFSQYCVLAELTVTFVAIKRGMVTADGPDICGAIVCSDLGIPEAAFAQQCSELALMAPPSAMPMRRKNTHKGSFGRVLIVGGNLGFGGAALLSARAALRSGAGLVSVATQPLYAAAYLSAQAELMVSGVTCSEDLKPLLAAADVIAVGPGLGTDTWAEVMLLAVLASAKPLVIDADALNLLAANAWRVAPFSAVLTPHPKEAARLLELAPGDINKNRFEAARSLVDRQQQVCVLKGAGSIVADISGLTVNISGNPGMATAGSGDVLTGLIAALLAQGMPLAEAARKGVYLHGLAGDIAAQQGQRGLLAGDIIEALRAVVN